MVLAGRIYVDTQIIVYATERHPVYAPALRSLWSAAALGTVKLFTSELSVLECLVLPYRRNVPQLVDAFEEIFASSDILTLHPVTRAILKSAAMLRAQSHMLNTPDSIHLATAQEQAVDQMLTNDFRLARVANISTVILQTLISP